MTQPASPDEINEHCSALDGAANRLKGVAHRTPTVQSRLLNQACNRRVHLKCENLQRGGAFKFRGAYNTIAQLDEQTRRRGILTFSSGNHAQAVALVASLFDVPATIVMPTRAPAVKREATLSYGATIVDYDPSSPDPEKRDRERVAKRILDGRSMTLVPPYDHAPIVHGQGTAAREHLEDCQLDYLLVPCGGGGLLAGSALAAHMSGQTCKVIGVEPERADDATRSFYSGMIHRVENPKTVADGTRTPSLGRVNFPIIRKLVHAMVTVSEQDIIDAVRFLFTRTKLVVEPSGALGVAALLSNAAAEHIPENATVGVILSGGNLDPSLL